MALVPEFISVLRDIRDIKYPDIVTKHGTVVAKEALMNPHYTAIDGVYAINTAVTNVNANATNINAVNANSTNINTNATNVASINTNATNIANINTTASNIANVNLVGTDLALGNSSNTKIVATDITKVNTVGTNIASVNTNATNIASINTNAANITAIQNASANAISALASKNSADADVILTHADVVLTHADVVTCTAKAVIANQILNMTAGASTLTAGSPASASFNPTTGVMTFGIPTGPTGAKGDPFVINAIGLIAGRTAYNTQPTGFSFFATDEGLIYFKNSATSGDWSAGAPFGKGDTGDAGNGIASITLTGTVGSVDTYRMLFTDSTFFDYTVTNSSVLDVNGRTGNVIITATDVGLANVDNTSDANKPISTATQTALNLKADATAISNIDNTSDADKPVSTAQQTALDLKVSGAVSSANAVHTIINDDSWIFNEDGTVTGALQIEITGLYSQTLSGMMKIMITQNGAVDAVYPDYDMLIGGAWRASDHTWHNTKASMDTIATTGLNVRFAHNGSQVFMLIGDTSTVWNYPRLVIREILSNSIIGGYTPDFTITRATSYPATVDSTLAISSALLKTGGTTTGAITSLRETSVAMPASDIDLATGNSFTKTITTTTTLTFSNIPASGQLIVWKLSLTNAGSSAVTFPTINWVLPDGTYSTSIATYLAANAPRTALKTSGVDTFIFYTENGGTTVYGKLF